MNTIEKHKKDCELCKLGSNVRIVEWFVTRVSLKDGKKSHGNFISDEEKNNSYKRLEERMQKLGNNRLEYRKCEPSFQHYNYI